MSEITPSSVPKIWRSSETASFSKSFELEVDDHLDIQFRSRQLLPLVPVAMAIGLIALFISLVAYFDKYQEGQIVVFTVRVTATIIFCVLSAILLLKPARQLLRARYRRLLTRDGKINQPVESIVNEGGFSYSVLGQRLTCSWDSLYAIEEEHGTIYFWMDNMSAHPWPARLFSSDEERQNFRDQVQKWSGRPIISPPVLARLGARGRQSLSDPGF